MTQQARGRSAWPVIVVIGRPGSGKGVQSEHMARHGCLEHVSTGELLRAAVSAGTPAGRAARPLLDAGALVPDDLVVGLLREQLEAARAVGRGVVLDGFPRTVRQAALLDEVLAPAAIDLVVHLQVPETVAAARMLARGRVDDTAATVEDRMAGFARDTAPLLRWYDARRLLTTIDGTREPGEVAASVRRITRETLGDCLPV